MEDARHIGIVAVSAEGAALCYRTICIEGASLLGAHNHPQVTMHTYPLADYMRHIDAGRWDGVGVRSTGLVGSYPPVLVTLRQTFTKAGTYPYRCLFHPAMAGAVKVG